MMRQASGAAKFKLLTLSRICLAAALALLTVAVTACGGRETPPTPDSQTSPAAETSPTAESSPATEISLTPPAGLTDIREGMLPENFPGEFPLHPAATVLFSGRFQSSDTEFFSVQLEIDDEFQSVVNFYSESFGAGPWSLQTNVTLDELTILSYSSNVEPALRGLMAIGPPTEEPGPIMVSYSLAVPPDD